MGVTPIGHWHIRIHHLHLSWTALIQHLLPEFPYNVY